MARGGRPGKKRTQYVRDAQGQFSSTPGGGKKATPSAVRKAAKAAALKGGTLAARTSLKKSRAKLAGIDKADQTLQTSLSKRAQKGAVTRGSKNLTKAIKSSRTRLIGAKPNANTIKKKRPVSMAYVLKDVTRSMSSDDAQRVLGKKPLAKRKISAPSKANTIKKKRSLILEAKPLQKPASQRPGSMTSTLRGALKSLAQADAQRIREIESITGQKLKPIKERAAAAAAAGERVRSTARGGKVSDTLRAGLRELAQSDARTMRGISQIVKDATPKVSGGKEKGKIRESAKSKLKRTGKIMKINRSRPLATTTKYNQAVPITIANKPRLDRARNVMQQAIESTIPFEKMKKLQTKAMVAQNPYSSMGKAQRTRAINDLAKAEIQSRKASRSYQAGRKASDIYTNVAGYTKGEGRVKWRRSGYRLTALGQGTVKGSAKSKAMTSSKSLNDSKELFLINEPSAPKMMGITRGVSGEAAAKTLDGQKTKKVNTKIKIHRSKPPTPTKEDRAIEKIRSLKSAVSVMGNAKQVFIPDKVMTPSRRKAIGLSAFKTNVESQRWRVSYQTFGNQEGISISERSSYQMQVPKKRSGIIRRTSRKAK